MLICLSSVLFEEGAYTSRLALIMQYGSELAAASPITRSLEYVTLLRPYDLQHQLTNFEYWWKEVHYEQRFRVRRHAELFVNWHCVNIFGITTSGREKFFVCVPLWCLNMKRNAYWLRPSS